MAIFETILISSACALGGVFIGAAVQKTAKFLYPYDWMTITILIAIVIDLIGNFTGFEQIWYVPFLLGYFVGYLIVGRTRYTMVMDISIVSKTMRMYPWVTYQHEGRLCIQEQTNRALLRRQLAGVRHEIVSLDGVAMNTDWTSDSKYPMFPKFEKNLLVLEDQNVGYRLVPIFWKVNARQYVTTIRVAYGSTASKLELMESANVLHDQQTTIVGLLDEVNKLKTALGPQLMEMAMRINHKAVAKSPENRMYNIIRKEATSHENLTPLKEVRTNGNAESTDEAQS